MWKLIKFFLSLAIVAIFAYFAFFVPLGNKTLFEHLTLISKTEEAQELEGAIKEKVKDAASEISQKLKQQGSNAGKTKRTARDTDAKANTPASNSGSQDDAPGHSPKDRKALDALVHAVDDRSNADRKALNRLIEEKNTKTN
ncbi:MAG: hypothetical protein QNJ97_18700 [Myxococcota bacterium]|nr:hypothetical protein [Myxococcota bacterium]